MFWNSLPRNLRDPSHTAAVFGRSLKIFLFSEYQCTQCIRGICDDALYKLMFYLLYFYLLYDVAGRSSVMLINNLSHCWMLSAWLEPVPNNPLKAYCRSCDATLLARFTILRQHAATSKHVQNEQCGLQMTSESNPNGLCHICTSVSVSTNMLLKCILRMCPAGTQTFSKRLYNVYDCV